MPRLFFAVELDGGVKAAIQEGIEGLAVSRPPWRWVARDNFHITLKFLGDVPSDRIDDLCGCARAVADSIPAFSIGLGAFGGFPNLRRPRVLVYRVSSGAEELAVLAQKLDASLAARLGVPVEARPFRAHVTVARVKYPIDATLASRLESALPLRDASQTVSQMGLMESRLRREGAAYQQVKGFALQNSKC